MQIDYEAQKKIQKVYHTTEFSLPLINQVKTHIPTV